MIVVIAILATISVVAYRGIQSRVMESIAKSDLANFAKTMELAKVSSADGLYPFPADSIGIKMTKNIYQTGRSNMLLCYTIDRTSYGIGVLTKDDRVFYRGSSGQNYETSWIAFNYPQTCSLADEGPHATTSGYIWDSGTSTGTWESWVGN